MSDQKDVTETASTRVFVDRLMCGKMTQLAIITHKPSVRGPTKEDPVEDSDSDSFLTWTSYYENSPDSIWPLGLVMPTTKQLRKVVHKCTEPLDFDNPVFSIFIHAELLASLSYRFSVNTSLMNIHQCFHPHVSDEGLKGLAQYVYQNDYTNTSRLQDFKVWATAFAFDEIYLQKLAEGNLNCLRKGKSAELKEVIEYAFYVFEEWGVDENYCHVESMLGWLSALAAWKLDDLRQEQPKWIDEMVEQHPKFATLLVKNVRAAKEPNFDPQGNLILTTDTGHKEYRYPEDGLDEYPCRFCDASFDNWMDKHEHMGLYHPGPW